jgi:hypothetical protein
MRGSIRTLKLTYARCFIFDPPRKFLLLDFAVKQGNIFSSLSLSVKC